MTDARCVLVAYVFTKEEEDTPRDGGGGGADESAMT